MARTTIWHGTPQEAGDLLAAIERHCTCAQRRQARVTTCPAHELLIGRQRNLDGLLFGRRVVDRLVREEWAETTTGAGE